MNIDTTDYNILAFLTLNFHKEFTVVEIAKSIIEDKYKEDPIKTCNFLYRRLDKLIKNNYIVLNKDNGKKYYRATNNCGFCSVDLIPFRNKEKKVSIEEALIIKSEEGLLNILHNKPLYMAESK